MTVPAWGALTSAVPAQPAQEAPVISVLEPGRAAHPGNVRLVGKLEGSEPFELTLNGERVHVTERNRWESWQTLGVGNNSLEFTVSDSTGASTEMTHQLLVLPDFEARDTRPIIYVSTAEELLGNLGNDRILVLSPGDYVLNRVDPARMAEGCERVEPSGNVVWRDFSNLDLVGTAGAQVRLLSDRLGGTALSLRACQKINFYSIQFVHDPRDAEGQPISLPDKSRGGCVSLGNTYVVRFRNCEFRGEGVGLAVRKINALAVAESTFQDCTGGAFRSKNSKHMTLADCTLVDNGRGRAGDLLVALYGDRIDIVFRGCEVRGNKPGPKLGLFDIDQQGLITYFHEGLIQDNHAHALTSGRAKDHLEAVKSKVQQF